MICLRVGIVMQEKTKKIFVYQLVFDYNWVPWKHDAVFISWQLTKYAVCIFPLHFLKYNFIFVDSNEANSLNMLKKIIFFNFTVQTEIIKQV